MSACDACRRRRVKCNRLQPCDRCTKSGINCTFGQSESRTSISYTRRLEQKVARLELLVGARSQSASESVESISQRDDQSIDLLIGPDDDYVYRCSTASSYAYYRYHASINVLRIIGDACGQERSGAGREMMGAISTLSSFPSSETVGLLPSHQRVLELTELGARRGLVCYDCLDRSEYSDHLDRLYTVDPDLYDDEDEVFLSLVFAALALGRRYEDSEAAEPDAKPNGLSYFQASRATMKKSWSTCNLNTIRTLILQIRFLLSNSKLPAAYNVLCKAIADALQMGLHLSTPGIEATFSADERFQRRRVFAVLYMMDTSLGHVIGVPKILTNVASSQILGLPDADLADDGAAFIARNPTSHLAEAVLAQKLYRAQLDILDMYTAAEPRSVQEAPADSVLDVQKQLEDWNESLPEIPDSLQDNQSLHGQLFLRLHHASAQVNLYRPFLHHLSRRRDDPRFSVRGFEFGSCCVRAAMQIVWLVEASRKNGVFNEAFWFPIFALAFAGSILTYFALYSQQRATVEESVSAARRASEMLAELAPRSPAARTINASLAPLIEACQRET